MNVDIKHALIGQLFEANFFQSAQIEQLQGEIATQKTEIESLKKPKEMPPVTEAE